MRRLRVSIFLAASAWLAAPVSASAQASSFERRPFLVVTGGLGRQGGTESSTASAYGGPQASIGVGVRVASSVAVRAEYGGQWYLRGAEAVTYPPCPSSGCTFPAQTEDLRAAHALAELRLRDRRGARSLTYLLAGASLAWARNDQGSPNALFAPQARRAGGATVGVGFGLRSAPLTDRSLRIEARYTALTHAVAATHSLVGVGLGLWI